MPYLISDISDDTELLPVNAALSNPTYPLFYDLVSETIKVVAEADTTEWQVIRGIGDSQAIPHSNGTPLIANASPYGGGGGSVTDREDFGGSESVTNITNGGTALLPWGSGFGPDTLLDLSAPTVPSVIAAGTYAVAVGVKAVVDQGNMSADGFFDFSLELDSDNTDASVVIESRLATAAKPLPRACISLTWYIPAAGTIRVRVHNWDGAATRSFSIDTAVVQRLA